MEDDLSVAKYELRKKLKKLKKLSGNGTELISVYIPDNYPIHEISQKLRMEAGQASNIKSKTTRKNVIDALEKIIHYLKTLGKTPKNGIAIFCGNISDNPAKTDIELFSVVPFEPLSVQIYRCDSKFFLEPLERYLSTKDAYGILVMDGKEATLAKLKGTQLFIIKKMNSNVHSKTHKGGQSAARYQRLIEGSIEAYYRRVGEAMSSAFLTDVVGVIVGGPGPTKDSFLKAKTYNYQIKILGVVDTGYTDEYGVQEVIEKAGDILKEQETFKEKRLFDRFMKAVVHTGLATYGLKETIKAIKSKQAERVLISENFPYRVLYFECDSCGKKMQKFAKDQEEENSIKNQKFVCECSGTYKYKETEDLIDKIIDMANENNIPVDVISVNTNEGSQFEKAFFGIGAFLRYRLD